MVTSRAGKHDLRVVLAVGGLDPCGGAGILADARAVQAAGAWPCTVSAVNTVQTANGLRDVRAVEPRWVGRQIKALAQDTKIRVVKTGALGGAAGVVRKAVMRYRIPHLIVDPVVRPSRGMVALTDSREVGRLLAIATLVTPNIPEAEVLLGDKIRNADDARDAANALRKLGCRAVLLKGGHAKGKQVVDWLAHEQGVVRIAHDRLRVGEVHGTGCTLASLIAGRLACRRARTKLTVAELTEVVRWSTRTMITWLQRAQKMGAGMRVLVG